MINDDSQTNSQNKCNNGDHRGWQRRESYDYGIHNSYLSLTVFIELQNIAQKGKLRVIRQESLKEMAVSYEILFARA